MTSVVAADRWAPSRGVDRSNTSLGASVFRISLALFITVAVARIQDIIPGLAQLHPGKLLALPIVVALVVALPRWQLLSALRTTTAKSVMLIVVLAALSIPLSVWPSYSARTFATALIPALILFIAVAAGFADRTMARLCILVLVLSVGADALYLLVGPAPVVKGRAYIGPGLDPNDSAALFVSALPFAMLLVSDRGWKRWLGLAVAMLLVAGVVKTGSRGGVIGLVAVAVVLIVQAAPRRRLSYVLGVVACAGAFALAADETIMSRLRTMFAPQSDYNFTEREGRVEVWKRGMGYMVAHPVLGVGLNSFETAEGVLSGKTNEGFGIRYTASHNAYVQVGAELGVIGLAAFLVALWSAGNGCRRIRRLAVRDHARRPQLADEEARLAAAACCALVGVATTIFFLSLAYHPVTLYALAVCVGVQAGSPYDLRKRRRVTESRRIRSAAGDTAIRVARATAP
jgi:O-antigen ligase